ncbi:MAG: DUF3592 domain-containing protein [Pseudomonadales bacterium]|jgi:hypothetical protein|nr:DUF3592 domain-containing protein [Pseudomonadales bacterium]
MGDLLADMNENPAAWSLLVSGFCVLAGLYSLLYQSRVRGWPWVWGILEGAAVKEAGGAEWAKAGQEYLATVRYLYEVNGRQFVGTRLSAMAMMASHNARALLDRQLEGVERRGDDQVKVYFDPRDPGQSYLINGSKTQLLVTLGLTALMGWVAFTSAVRLDLL